MKSILTLFFGWAVKVFQFFFPPHHKVDPKYALLFAISLALLLYSSVTTYYIYARVWHNPQFPYGAVSAAAPTPAAIPMATPRHRNTAPGR